MLSLGKTEPKAVLFSFSQDHKMLFYVSDLSYLSDRASFIWRQSSLWISCFRKSMCFVWECFNLWAAPVQLCCFWLKNSRTKSKIDFKIRKIPRHAFTSAHLIYSHPNWKSSDLLPHSLFILDHIKVLVFFLWFFSPIYFDGTWLLSIFLCISKCFLSRPVRQDFIMEQKTSSKEIFI